MFKRRPKKKPKFHKKTFKNQNFKKKKVKMANYGIKRPLTPFMLFAKDHRQKLLKT
jgi:hypothetical protein